MANPIVVEICVESLDYAVAAERGGADRIELCDNLACGGITPGVELIRAVRQRVRIPVYGMIRPRPGDFCYSRIELEAMKRDIELAKDSGLDGIVSGVLDPMGRVDIVNARALVLWAHPLPLTFHRAFDQCPDLPQAVEAVVETGAKRILTSGGKSSVIDGLPTIRSLLSAAGDRIVIMVGGGIRSVHIERILRDTGVREIHTSLGGYTRTSSDNAASESASSAIGANLFEDTVRKFRQTVEAVASDFSRET